MLGAKRKVKVGQKTETHTQALRNRKSHTHKHTHTHSYTHANTFAGNNCAYTLAVFLDATPAASLLMPSAASLACLTIKVATYGQRRERRDKKVYAWIFTI